MFWKVIAVASGIDDDAGLNLMGELRRVFGNDKVLTEPEDLYVYSFYGGFAARRHKAPVAVLKIWSQEVEDNLKELAERWRVQILRIDERTPLSVPGDGAPPFLLWDSRKPVDGKHLFEILSNLQVERQQLKKGLRGAASSIHWLISSLKAGEKYRVHAQPDGDSGFCVVQSSFDGSETFSSKGRLLLSKGLLKGELNPTDRLVDSIYSCTACGQCYDQFTDSGLEINNAIVRARRELVERGVGPRQCALVMKNLLENGNPLGMPAEDRAIWFEDLLERFHFEENDVLYWAGCSTAYRLPEVVKSTAAVLEKAGVDFGLLGEGEGCCGLILYLTGLWSEAAENAEKIFQKSRELGVKTMVTSCAGCYYAFTRVYPLLGRPLPIQVYHTSQLFESLVRSRDLELRGRKGSYAWHDPCDLGRHCGVYEPPRNVLRAIPGIELTEPPLTRQHALCCGAGGGLWMYDAAVAEGLGRSKISQEFSGRNLDGIVTGCPACILNLRYSARSIDEEIEVQDLSQIIEKCL